MKKKNKKNKMRSFIKSVKKCNHNRILRLKNTEDDLGIKEKQCSNFIDLSIIEKQNHK
ncbi:MAG: hypothetical protein IKQ61_01515 [Spirochaetales bacterium]|nr:hypothetical protein [Spirochaetales bacterium]